MTLQTDVLRAARSAGGQGAVRTTTLGHAAQDTPNQSLLSLVAEVGLRVSDDSNDIPSPDERARRLAWFDEYTGAFNGQPTGLPLRCPCCGCKTLEERAMFDICEVCYWEDDGQDDHNGDVVLGGPNGSLSLSEARANYLRFGACEASMVENVRPPRPEELPGVSNA